MDWGYWLFVSPALLLAVLAQILVKAVYARARRCPAPLSGFAAARQILDAAGLQEIAVQQTLGFLSDHYDSHQKVLRLSKQVYHGRTSAAVGIAAHEAGHALQHALGNWSMAIRNAATAAASFGSTASWVLLLLGAVLKFTPLLHLGTVLLGSVVYFQLINLPIEWIASARAKARLTKLEIAYRCDMRSIAWVLFSSTLANLAAPLQLFVTLLSLLLRLLSRRRKVSG